MMSPKRQQRTVAQKAHLLNAVLSAIGYQITSAPGDFRRVRKVRR
jgi:hypothetical protein